MPCCCRQRADKGLNDPVFVPYKDRKCTDALFCLIFLLFWLGMAVIAAIAFVQGDPNRLTNGSDYEGRACGTNGQPGKVYYPRITEDIVAFVKEKRTNLLDITLFGVCVSKCPSYGDIVCTTDGSVAISAAKTALSTSTNAETLTVCKLSSSYLSLNSDIRTNCATTRKNCWVVPLNTTDYFNRSRDDLVAAGLWSQCVSRTVVTLTVSTEPAQSNPALDMLFSSAAKFGAFVADIKNAIVVILVCGGAGSVLLGFVWLILLRWFAGCMVWSSIFATLSAAAAVTLIAYFKAGILTASHVSAAASALDSATGVSVNVTLPGELTTASSNMETQWSYFAYAMTAVSVILLFVVAWLRSSIKIAVGIIKEASVALRSMLSLLLCPIAMVLALGSLFVYWIFVTAYMASAGDDITSNYIFSAAADFANSTLLLCASDNSTANTSTCDTMLSSHAFAASNSKRFALLYHLFGLLWTSQFIMGMGIMVVAGAVSQWYYTRDKRAGLPRCMCWRACGRTARFHLGTVAFGSLLIAIVQFFRLILAYLDRRSKELQDRNKVVKVVFKLVQCCLWCFEKCVKFVSQYAYILVAMQGESFCTSAVAAVGIIASNVKQIGALSTISSLLFLLGKIFIVASSGIAGFLWLDNAPAFREGGSHALQSQLVPLAVLVLLAYAIASGFLGVYQQTVTTLLLAFCEDKAKHAGTQEDPYFMSDGLRKAVGLPEGSNKPAAAKQGGDDKGIELVNSLEAKEGPAPIDTYSTKVVPFSSTTPRGSSYAVPGGKPKMQFI